MTALGPHAGRPICNREGIHSDPFPENRYWNPRNPFIAKWIVMMGSFSAFFQYLIHLTSFVRHGFVWVRLPLSALPFQSVIGRGSDPSKFLQNRAKMLCKRLIYRVIATMGLFAPSTSYRVHITQLTLIGFVWVWQSILRLVPPVDAKLEAIAEVAGFPSCSLDPVSLSVFNPSSGM